VPATFAEVFEELGRGGYLSEELAASLVSLARFRNLLVHGYADVDDDRVVEMLTGNHLRDLGQFRAELTDHITAGAHASARRVRQGRPTLQRQGDAQIES
jgi:uncharacterized protein YutE (UPF0331/DUF86 family)